MKYLFKPFLYAVLLVSLFMGGLQAYAVLGPGGGGGLLTPSALCQVSSGVWNFCKTTDVLGNSSNPITNGYFTDLTAVTMAISGTVSGNLSVGGNTTLGDASTDSVTINGITVSLSNGNTTTFNDGTNTLMTLADNGTSGILTVNTLVPTAITGWAIGSNVQAYSSLLADIAALATTDSNIIVGNGSTWVAESGATARTSLGLTIGTNVQGYSSLLADIAALATTDSNFIVANGSTWVAETGATARTSLGVAIGTDVQAYDADLTTYAGITPSANIQTFLGSADYATARTNLGVAIGSNVQAYSSLLTDMAALATTDSNFIVGNGSTWVAENGATARTSLGLAIGTNVQAYDTGLAAIADLATTDSNFIVGNGTTWVAEDATTAKASIGLGSVENTALSSWAGTTNITTLGTIGSGTWNATAIDEGKIDWVVTSNVIDFGGATSLEIPNGVNPTVNALGEMALDSSADQLVLYGSAERVFDWRRQKSVTIESPADADNFLLGKWQQDITITDIHCIVDPAGTGESVVIDIEERDSTGDNPATVDATITCDNDGAEDDGTLTNGPMDANDWWSIDVGVVTGTVTQVSVDIFYTINRK